MARNINIGQMTRAEKEEKVWVITSIISLLVGLAIIGSYLFVLDQPFEQKHPADHYWFVYLGISAISIAILGAMRYFRLDEKNKKVYNSIIGLLETNMWIAIISIVIVVLGVILTYLIMM